MALPTDATYAAFHAVPGAAAILETSLAAAAAAPATRPAAILLLHHILRTGGPLTPRAASTALTLCLDAAPAYVLPLLAHLRGQVGLAASDAVAAASNGGGSVVGTGFADETSYVALLRHLAPPVSSSAAAASADAAAATLALAVADDCVRLGMEASRLPPALLTSLTHMAHAIGLPSAARVLRVAGASDRLPSPAPSGAGAAGTGTGTEAGAALRSGSSRRPPAPQQSSPRASSPGGARAPLPTPAVIPRVRDAVHVAPPPPGQSMEALLASQATAWAAAAPAPAAPAPAAPGAQPPRKPTRKP